MMYQPDEDPFLMADDGSISSGPRPRNDNYQYQPQSMYQLPVGPPQGQQPYPQNYPPNGQPRRLKSVPSMYANGPPMPPPGPVMRPTPSFYGDPMMGPPVVGQPMLGQPYGVPVQAQPYGYVQPVPMQAPAYIPNACGYRDVRGSILNDQIEEFNRYHSTRPRNSNNEENSLLIATLVSEQDAMYGTNMLENITPADLEYIQGLMSRGAPEHEAYRMAFERKPHTVRPPKVVGETFADKKALEDAIQASLTESSRRACRPDTSPNDRADQEALEKAIQLSLQENSSQYSDQTTSNNTHISQAHVSSSYRDEGSYSGADYYSERGEDRRQASDPETRPFDRQYPYNLSTERPIETLSRPKPVNTMTEEDYTRARLLREAEELRARAYGGGSVVSGASEYSSGRGYPNPNQHHRQYRNEGDDEYTVDSRNSRGSHGSRGSRTMDSRSEYSYDRHPQHGHGHGHNNNHGQGHGHGHGHGHNNGHSNGHSGLYAETERAVYSSTSHSTTHRSAPGPHHHAQPYASQPYAPQHGAAAGYYNDHRPPSPSQYRVEEADYDSQSEEAKDDFDHRRAYVQQDKKHSRSSNYTSTSSMSAADEGEYTPRSNDGSFRSPYNQYGSGPGQSPYRPASPPRDSYGDSAQYTTTSSAHYSTTTNRSPAVPPLATHPARTASPMPNNPLARVPSFITPRTQSPVPTAGGPVPTLTRAPFFRPPVAPTQVTPRVGIAGEAEAANDGAATATANATTNVSSTTSVDGSVVSSSDPSLPQFERRKTLMRLVSKLTIDSDED